MLTSCVPFVHCVKYACSLTSVKLSFKKSVFYGLKLQFCQVGNIKRSHTLHVCVWVHTWFPLFGAWLADLSSQQW